MRVLDGGPPSAEPVKLLIVLVLYKCRFADSPTFASLIKQRIDADRDVYLLYDNSPASKFDDVPDGWLTRRDPGNGGLLKAYSYALAEAVSNGCAWILFLDQDTVLPSSFLARMRSTLQSVHDKSDVAAVVPIVMVGSRQLSPMRPSLCRETPVKRRNVVVSDWTMAINSGSCVRVGFIEAIGGFSEEFWLDYLDHWLFRMIKSRSKSVYVSDLEIKHDLSVADMNRGVSVERYKNVLSAELKFTNRYLPMPWRLMLAPRLAVRSIKHLIYTRDKRLGLLMAKAAFAQACRLFTLNRSKTESTQHGGGGRFSGRW